MSTEMWYEIAVATWETIYMVLLSGFIATILGAPLGIILLTTKKHGILENKLINLILSGLTNCLRSIPFIILLIAIIPLTRFIVGTSIGTTAAIVPLTVGAIPFVARIVENVMSEVGFGLMEAGLAMGATPFQIIAKILLPESMSGIISGITIVLINLVGYSAMAGAIGGGGLGDLAVRYGYQRFDVSVMIYTVIILIILVQIMQYLGDQITKLISHR